MHAQHFLAMLAREKDAASQEMAAAFEHVRKVMSAASKACQQLVKHSVAGNGGRLRARALY